MNNEKALKEEKETISLMIGLYCRGKHDHPDRLCAECQELEAYAHRRLENCQFMPQKPVCARCPIYCYKPAARQQMREVMRYAGPRMLIAAPAATVRHLWQSFKPESQRVRQARARMSKAKTL